MGPHPCDLLGSEVVVGALCKHLLNHTGHSLCKSCCI
jgi:hypothetical protein